MNVVDKLSLCIDRMKADDVSLQDYINSYGVVSVTDKDVKTGVDRLIYNHALNKTQISTICSTSLPTLNLVEKRLLEEGRVSESFIQGKSSKYNRFDVAVFMEEFGVKKYSDLYKSIVIAIANLKGGVGKSTTVRTLAMAAALDTTLNANVLVGDLDPQGSCGLQGQPRDSDAIYLTLADISLRDLREDSPFYRYLDSFEMSEEDVILAAAIPTHLPNLFVYSAFPYDEDYTDFFHTLSKDDQGILLSQLSDFIMPVLKKHFDLIFLDSPPQDGPITWSALKAADLLLTPIAPKPLDYISTQNFVRFTRNRVIDVGAVDNLKEWKILPVMVDYSDRSHMLTLDRIRGCYGDRLTNSVIKQSSLFYAADSLHRTIYDIQKTECKNNRYASANQFDQAIESSNAVYMEIRGIIINLASGGHSNG